MTDADSTDSVNLREWAHHVECVDGLGSLADELRGMADRLDAKPTGGVAVEAVVQQAIEEWATIHGGPNPSGDPTLAHYIVSKLRQSEAEPTSEFDPTWAAKRLGWK